MVIIASNGIQLVITKVLLLLEDSVLLNLDCTVQGLKYVPVASIIG